MGNNINHLHAINFTKLFYTPQNQENYKNKKNEVVILSDKFSWLLFIYIE